MAKLTKIGTKVAGDIIVRNSDWAETDETSPSYIFNKPADAPQDDKQYARCNGVWVEAGKFEDAPEDGAQYARQNGEWTVVSGGTNADWNEEDETSPAYILNKPEDAPSDNNAYARKNGAWSVIDSTVDSWKSRSEKSGSNGAGIYVGSKLIADLSSTIILGSNSYSNQPALVVGSGNVVSAEQEEYFGDNYQDYRQYDYNTKTPGSFVFSGLRNIFGTVIGKENSALHYNSIIIGNNNFTQSAIPFNREYYPIPVSDDDGYTIAIGMANSAIRNYDMAIGYCSLASGGENLALTNSIAMGYRNVAIGHSIVSGGGIDNIALNGSKLFAIDVTADSYMPARNFMLNSIVTAATHNLGYNNTTDNFVGNSSALNIGADNFLWCASAATQSTYMYGNVLNHSMMAGQTSSYNISLNTFDKASAIFYSSIYTFDNNNLVSTNLTNYFSGAYISFNLMFHSNYTACNQNTNIGSNSNQSISLNQQNFWTFDTSLAAGGYNNYNVLFNTSAVNLDRCISFNQENFTTLLSNSHDLFNVGKNTVDHACETFILGYELTASNTIGSFINGRHDTLSHIIESDVVVSDSTIIGANNATIRGRYNKTLYTTDSLIKTDNSELQFTQKSLVFGSYNSAASLIDSMIVGSNNRVDTVAPYSIAYKASDVVYASGTGRNWLLSPSTPIYTLPSFTALTISTNEVTQLSAKLLNITSNGNIIKLVEAEDNTQKYTSYMGYYSDFQRYHFTGINSNKIYLISATGTPYIFSAEDQLSVANWEASGKPSNYKPVTSRKYDYDISEFVTVTSYYSAAINIGYSNNIIEVIDGINNDNHKHYVIYNSINDYYRAYSSEFEDINFSDITYASLIPGKKYNVTYDISPDNNKLMIPAYINVPGGSLVNLTQSEQLLACNKIFPKYGANDDPVGNVIIGCKNQSDAKYGYILGCANRIYDHSYYSFALGCSNTVSGANAMAFGGACSAIKHLSIAIGNQLVANEHQTVIGKYNEEVPGVSRAEFQENTKELENGVYTAMPADYMSGVLFVVGNGHATSGDNKTYDNGYDESHWNDESFIVRSNAMIVSADGTVSAAKLAIPEGNIYDLISAMAAKIETLESRIAELEAK